MPTNRAKLTAGNGLTLYPHSAQAGRRRLHESFLVTRRNRLYVHRRREFAHGRAIEKVELYLATSSGENAGHFVMSPDEAESLLNGRISPAKYFIANVMF